MRLDMIVHVLKPNSILTKAEFKDIVLEFEPTCSERSIYWKMNKLCEMGILKKLAHNTFSVAEGDEDKAAYFYPHSDLMLEVIDKIEKAFPLVDFQVWESIQFNEFINHQIGKNVLFVEVEHMLEESVFNMLAESYSKVLCCPNRDTFYLYFEENMIVVQKLITESPKPVAKTKSCCLEKLLVDLFSNKIMRTIIEGAEYPGIYEDAFHNYRIDEKKMFRYARRRNKEKEIRKFIKERTDIMLITEEKIANEQKL